jgi:hypothetical protein
LARGRQKLRIRLTRRGLAPAAGGVAVADWLGESASAAVSVMLREATVRGAIATALGRSTMTGAVSATAASLTTGALRGMAMASLKTASMTVMMGLSLLFGGGLLARGISADGPAPAVAEAPKRAIAVKQAPAKKAVPGGVSLGGIVLRPGGRPVSKATVIIGQRNIVDSTVRLETNKDGRFQSGPVFAQQPEREMVVTAIAPGLAWTETTVRVTQPMPPVTIRLTPRQPLHGRVVDLKGKPVQGAAVEPTSEFRGGHFDWKAETDADGRPLGLDAHRGKFVLLDLWATDQPETRANLPHLKATHDAFGQDPRFVMIGLNQDIDPDYARRYAARHGIDWEQRHLGSLYEPNPIRASLGVVFAPQILLIGPDGRLIAKDLHGDAIKQAVAEALKPKG